MANVANKLNIADKTTIDAHGQEILGVVAALELQLADAEQQTLAAKLRCAECEISQSTGQSVGPMIIQPAPATETHADKLKRPQGKPAMPLPTRQESAVVFNPVDDGGHH